MDMYVNESNFFSATEAEVLSEVVERLSRSVYDERGSTMCIQCKSDYSPGPNTHRVIHCKKMIKPLAEDLAYVFASKLFQEHHAPYCYSRVPQFNWASEELENGTNVWCDTMFLRLEHGYICCFALTIDDDQYRRSHVALLGTMQAACLLLGPRDNGADLLLKILPHIELDGISEEDHRFIDETIDEVFDSDTESVKAWKRG